MIVTATIILSVYGTDFFSRLGAVHIDRLLKQHGDLLIYIL